MRNFKLTGLLIFIGIFFSCTRDDDNVELNLNGTYTESEPFAGTHQLNFVDNNTLILTARNSTDEEFKYELGENTIKLTPIRDLNQTWDLEINVIDVSKFEITNIFYASIPEDEDPVRFVTFKK